MALVPASCQGIPLRDSYLALRQRPEPEWQRCAELMLALVPHLERICAEVPVWSLLSHERTCLLAVDDYRAPWYVIIAAWGVLGSYDVRYIMPATEAPWPGAVVVGDASTAERAAEMVRAAMVKSRAWPDLR